MSIDVKDKTILITGSNRGIGKAILESCIQHGATKIYAGVRSLTAAQPLVDAHGDSVVPVHVDLNDPASIISAAATAHDVEIVINNAGILCTANPLAENAIEEFRKEIEVNVFGLMRMAQAFAPVLKANGGGAFVQLNSVASMKSFPDFATYCASKAAAYSITQALKDVLAEQGTAVLSVHPGPIATDMASDAGLTEMADPPEMVGNGVVAALKAGDFHLFPDTMAQQVGAAYASFAENIVEANLMEG